MKVKEKKGMSSYRCPRMFVDVTDCVTDDECERARVKQLNVENVGL